MALSNDSQRSPQRPAGKEKWRRRCRSSSRLFDALRRGAEATGTADSQGFWTLSRTAHDAKASLRRTLLAKSLVKPSLRVIIQGRWYNRTFIKMLDCGRPPDDWNALLKQAKKDGRRLETTYV